MITSYILMLVVSVWLVAYLLVRLSTRLSPAFGSAHLVSAGMYTLVTVLGFLVVVGAPPLLIIAAMAAASKPFARLQGQLFPDSFAAGSVALALCLIPLAAASLLSAPSFLALDAAMILSALLGGLMAQRGYDRMGAAWAPFLVVVGWMIYEALLYNAWPSAVASLLAVGAALIYTRTRLSREPVHAL